MASKDLEAHLAALVRLENVGALLGAGASMGPLGGMTLPVLWNHFKAAYQPSHEWLIDHGFVQAVEPHPPNVEVLVDVLDIARGSSPEAPVNAT